MKVRDHLLSVKEYKGRWTEAAKEDCACCSCYNAHDCGHYGHNNKGKYDWITEMRCATRDNSECPSIEKRRYVHYSKRSIKNIKLGAQVLCHRCKQRIKIEEGVVIFSEKDNEEWKMGSLFMLINRCTHF